MSKATVIRFLFCITALLMIMPCTSALGVEIIEPGGGLDLNHGDDSRLRLAFMSFTSPVRDEDEREGWLLLLQSELTSRDGYEGRYEVVPRNEWKDLVLKATGSENIWPAKISTVNELVSVDYILFLNERWTHDGWIWLLRVYNGRSGAFVFESRIPVTNDHSWWMLDRFLFSVESLKSKNGELDTINVPCPLKHLPAGELKKLTAIFNDCRLGECGKWLDQLHTWSLTEPDLAQALMSNSMFSTQLMKQASNPYDVARVNRLSGERMEAKKGLDNSLPEIQEPGQRLAHLLLLARLAIETERPDEAKQYYEQAELISPNNTEIDLGLAEILSAKGDCSGALARYAKAEVNTQFRTASFTGESICLSQIGQIQQSVAAKERLAAWLDAIGRHREATEIWAELLQVDFTFKWLKHLRFHLLQKNLRESFENVMTRFSIREDEESMGLLKKLAALLDMAGKYDDADRVRRSALHTVPEDPDFINEVAWHAVTRKKQAVEAKSFLEKLPVLKRDRYTEALVDESLESWDRTLKIIKETKWSEGVDIEAALVGLRVLEKMGEGLLVMRECDKWNALYPEREEFLLAKGRIENASGSEKFTSPGLLAAWQTAGYRVDESVFGRLINRDVFEHMISPHPLASHDALGNLMSPGRVLLVQGEKKGRTANWYDALQVYVPQKDYMLLKELDNLMDDRYQLLTDEVIRREMENKFSNMVRMTKSNLADMALAAGVDSIFMLIYDPQADQQLKHVSISMRLYFYDGKTGTIFRTSAVSDAPFFSYYKFNKSWLFLPGGFMIFLLLFFLWFKRATLHMSSPLAYARYLIKQRNYHKAVQVLEKYGFLDDKLWVSGLAYMKEGNPEKAMESFLRAKDLENAYFVMQFCQNSADVENMKGELFLRMGEFNRSIAAYHTARNLIGISRVLSASGDETKAARVMAQYYLESKNPIAAIGQYKRIKDYERAGQVFYHYQKYEEAAELFEKCGNYDMTERCRKRMGKRRNNVTSNTRQVDQ